MYIIIYVQPGGGEAAATINMYSIRQGVHVMSLAMLQIAASLLLFMEEEDTFWMMCAIIEDLLPASYYSSTLIGIQVHCMLGLICLLCLVPFFSNQTALPFVKNIMWTLA